MAGRKPGTSSGATVEVKQACAEISPPRKLRRLPHGLSPKQCSFVAEFLVDKNATQAAIRAGYSPKTAEVQGCRLLRNVKVALEVGRGLERIADAAEMTAIDVLRAIGRRVKADATCDIRSLFDANGDLRPITELSASEALMIAGFEVVMKNATAGDGKIDRIVKVRVKDQAPYVEMAAKHFALLQENIRLSVEGVSSMSDEELMENIQRLAAKYATPVKAIEAGK